MDYIYNSNYFHSFYAAEGGGSYSDKDKWYPFFDNIAKNIVENYAPKLVLDAGCAYGYLVEALRSRGVEAYGIDISEHAISSTAESIKEYCRVWSVAEKLPGDMPQRYDLIITIEVFEHLLPEVGECAVSNLVNYADRIIFSSTETDYEDQTHRNVQKKDYWARLFAKNSFFRDLYQNLGYICEQADFYQKRNDVENIIQEYEIWNRVMKLKADVNSAEQLEQKLLESEAENQALKERTELLERKWKEAQAEHKAVKSRYEEAVREKNELERMLAQSNSDLYTVTNAFFWRLTRPARVMCDNIKKAVKKVKPLYFMLRGLKSIKNSGMAVTWRKTEETLSRRNRLKFAYHEYCIPEARRKKEEKAEFSSRYKFSILVPLYNTPENFLVQMMDSVCCQTYQNWELCLADGSDKKHQYVEAICRKYAGKDRRIKYQKLEKNLGISENTNACIEMATGDYIALFDHDDILHPSALYSAMCAAAEKQADFIFTDEAVFETRLDHIISVHFKADYGIDNLRANNYICHFTVFKRELLKKTGNFRKAYDGSQDHDMILRLTEQAENIIHIPRILYYWRAHPGSVASSVDSKAYAIAAGRNAVLDSVRRNGMEAVIESTAFCPTIYRIKYEIPVRPFITIVILNSGSRKHFSHCITSVLELSAYSQYEILVINHGKNSADCTRDLHDTVKRDKIRIIDWNKAYNESAMYNEAASSALGEILLFLNSETEIISSNWIEEMLMYAQRSDVGAVGAKLYNKENKIRYAGLVLGHGEDRIAGNICCTHPRESTGYMGRLKYAQDISAVTGACVMIRKSVFINMHGLREEFSKEYNMVDFCLRLKQEGLLVVFTPYAELYCCEFRESNTGQKDEKVLRLKKEARLFHKKWDKVLSKGDPYYNPNFDPEQSDYSFR